MLKRKSLSRYEKGFLLYCFCPIDRFLSLGREYLVGFAEVPTAKETSVCRQGRGVGCCKYIVLSGVYQLAFGYGGVPPQQEHYAVALFRQLAYHLVGKLFPTMSVMRTCFMSRYTVGYKLFDNDSLPKFRRTVAIALRLTTSFYMIIISQTMSQKQYIIPQM